MKEYISSFLNKIFAISKLVTRNWEDEVLIMQAKNLMSSNHWKSSIKESGRLEEKEFKVYSQWGDDGIIQFLIKTLDIKNKYFIEFGVADFYESNSHFLLVNNNWKGLVIDGSEKNINRLKNSSIYWRYNLKAIKEFITKDNIMSIISSEVETEIGLLHIDLDGNDYWILKEIDFESLSPEIVILEYNYVFGHERKITVPYEDSFHRFKEHSCGLFFGASLGALNDYMSKKGYIFVGSNSARNNAYFVKENKKDLINQVDITHEYVDAQFRISRDEKGNLDYVQPDKIIEEMRGLKVYNIETNKLEEF
ncbi:MAG: hypothetical protein CMA43_00880 [Euryarchaeota archaeon]|nr:hypothetical protein [Euryarchaeota archaeon]|tara:strand:- start:2114 stop:3037 length:924 start_codon:yes stop_codon:yes gene_type:complete